MLLLLGGIGIVLLRTLILRLLGEHLLLDVAQRSSISTSGIASYVVLHSSCGILELLLLRCSSGFLLCLGSCLLLLSGSHLLSSLVLAESVSRRCSARVLLLLLLAELLLLI